MVKPRAPDQRAELSLVQRRGKVQREQWEQVVPRENLLRALGRVEANGRAPGIDGMTVEMRVDEEGVAPYLQENKWPEIKQRLDAGTLPTEPCPAGWSLRNRVAREVVGDFHGAGSRYPRGVPR